MARYYDQELWRFSSLWGLILAVNDLLLSMLLTIAPIYENNRTGGNRLAPTIPPLTEKQSMNINTTGRYRFYRITPSYRKTIVIA
jgi:hypothetical protein